MRKSILIFGIIYILLSTGVGSARDVGDGLGTNDVSVAKLRELRAKYSAGVLFDPIWAYGLLSGKTVLMPNGLGVRHLSADDLPEEPIAALAKIETAFSNMGVTVVQDGPHFVRLSPNSMMALPQLQPPLHGAELAVHASQTKTGTETNKELLQAGTVGFMNSDLRQVAPIYGKLSRRTVLRSSALSLPMTLWITSPITREEGVYAMDTVFALHGLLVVEDGDYLVQVVAREQLGSVKTNAPRRKAGAKLLDPRIAPSIGSDKVLSKTEREMERLRKLFYDFMHQPDPRQRIADRLLAFYAGLAGKGAIESPTLGGTYVPFNVETPLTREELMYAIEKALELNDLAVVPVDKKSIRLGRLSESRGAGKKE